jgi:putative ABC transport system permease protein
MFKNYLLVALRNMKKHKWYSFINIAGLALGIACCILMLLWVRYEFSFDRFHENADEIYRIISEVPTGNQIIQNARTPNPIGSTLKDEYPEVVNFTMTQGVEGWLVRYGEKQFVNDKIAMANPSFFKMFTFPFVKGDPGIAFNEPHSLVITERMAKKYFGDEEPMGKVVKIYADDFIVTGVIKNLPQNSHIMFDCIIPIINMENYWEANFKNWKDPFRFYTYIQLRKGSSWKDVSKKISGIVKKHLPESNIEVYLQPLTDIHLSSDFKMDLDNYNQGNITYIYIFSLTAFFILLISCFGFMNLSTARHGARANEVGMRKVVGADRKALIWQFLLESIIISFISFLLALVFVYLFLPLFNNLIERQLTLGVVFSGNIQIILELVGITLLAGIIAGSYPALFLSAFQPVTILKGIGKVDRRVYLRKTLMVLQYILVIILMLGTPVVYRQLQYIKTKDLGYQKENVLYMPAMHLFARDDQAKKNEFLQNPNVLSVTGSVPPIFMRDGTENVDWEGKYPEQKISINPISVDYDYLKTFNMKMAQGRFFSREYSTDISNYILNETAVKMMGMQSPLGKRFSIGNQQGTVIGVVKDYHHGSLHTPIEPIVFKLFYEPEVRMISIRVNSTNVPGTLKFIESKYKKIAPNFLFRYNFLDETIDNFYKTEQKLGSIARYLTFLTMFIACLGLLGLSLYLVEQRTKEIGIRKVFGASVSGIIWLISKEFMKWVMIAFIIACPLAWYVMNHWLQNFVYRTSIEWWMFVFTGVAALAIAFLTISFQTIKAARTNPVESLKYE